MSIEYRDTKEFDVGQLKELFLSVEWSSGEYPEKLQQALARCDSVYSAWDGDKLVGLINALSDGVMTAYFHYLLVRPEYQGMGVGTRLIELMIERYRECARKVLIAYDHQVGFYERRGFKVGDGSTPMFLTYLST